jgi:hypothetical protein
VNKKERVLILYKFRAVSKYFSFLLPIGYSAIIRSHNIFEIKISIPIFVMSQSQTTSTAQPWLPTLNRCSMNTAMMIVKNPEKSPKRLNQVMLLNSPYKMADANITNTVKNT